MTFSILNQFTVRTPLPPYNEINPLVLIIILLGAAAYFFRHIMHDWPDDACIIILKQTAKAMDKYLSRILICDQVVAESEPSSMSLLYDIDMMALFGGKERTLKEWKLLLRRADSRLQITDVRKTEAASTTILEVRLDPSI